MKAGTVVELLRFLERCADFGCKCVRIDGFECAACEARKLAEKIREEEGF